MNSKNHLKSYSPLCDAHAARVKLEKNISRKKSTGLSSNSSRNSIRIINEGRIYDHARGRAGTCRRRGERPTDDDSSRGATN